MSCLRCHYQPQDIRPEMLCLAPLELPGPGCQLPWPRSQFFPKGVRWDRTGWDIFAEVAKKQKKKFGEPPSALPCRDIAQQS